jgi:hypothetical protein
VFLSTKGESASRFVLGIGLYFSAHLGYLLFALSSGGVSWLWFGILLVALLPYYVLFLRPAISDARLSLAVLLYLLISCAGLSAAIGIGWPGVPRALFVTAIALILCSDLFISFLEFLDWHRLDALILPTYYLAHLLIAWSVMLL